MCIPRTCAYGLPYSDCCIPVQSSPSVRQPVENCMTAPHTNALITRVTHVHQQSSECSLWFSCPVFPSPFALTARRYGISNLARLLEDLALRDAYDTLNELILYQSSFKPILTNLLINSSQWWRQSKSVTLSVSFRRRITIYTKRKLVNYFYCLSLNTAYSSQRRIDHSLFAEGIPRPWLRFRILQDIQYILCACLQCCSYD